MGGGDFNYQIRYRPWTTKGASVMESEQQKSKTIKEQWQDSDAAALLDKISDANFAFDKFLVDNALLFTNSLLGAFLVSTFQLIIGGWFWPFVLTIIVIGLRFVRKKNPPGDGRMNAT